MPRTNKVTARVFTDISKMSIKDFVKVDSELGLRVSTTQSALLKKYNALAGEAEFAEVLEAISGVEEIIIQLRCKQIIKSELRLSLSRNYIYARSLFYRRGKEINDIRVVVGITEKYGDDINSLINKRSFRSLSTRKLMEVMDKEIEHNITKLKPLIGQV